MTGQQNITLIVGYPGPDQQRMITFTLGTSYFDAAQTNVIYNCTGVDPSGNNYTAKGMFDRLYKFKVTDIVLVVPTPVRTVRYLLTSGSGRLLTSGSGKFIL